VEGVIFPKPGQRPILLKGEHVSRALLEAGWNLLNSNQRSGFSVAEGSPEHGYPLNADEEAR
jgi:hypothetical protein